MALTYKILDFIRIFNAPPACGGVIPLKTGSRACPGGQYLLFSHPIKHEDMDRLSNMKIWIEMMQRKMRMEDNEELERVCCNCNNFFPATMDDTTEFGICLNDKEFEPFIDELLDNYNYACCKALVEEKKFTGDSEACPEFSEVDATEFIEIDENSRFGKKLISTIKSGNMKEKLDALIIEEQLRNIDLKTLPVDKYLDRLKGPDPQERNGAISSLSALITCGNEEAFEVLFEYFKKLPPPKKLEEVHFKIDLLQRLETRGAKAELIPLLISDLYETPSNNTTRQWIRAILRSLKKSPYEEVRSPLLKMLKDKRFSYRLKKKMKDILCGQEDIF